MGRSQKFDLWELAIGAIERRSLVNAVYRGTDVV